MGDCYKFHSSTGHTNGIFKKKWDEKLENIKCLEVNALELTGVNNLNKYLPMLIGKCLKHSP